MAEDWSKVAVEVAEAIASVGFAAVLEVPTVGPFDGSEGSAFDFMQYPVTILDDRITRRDVTGMVVGTTRVLTMAGNGVVPEKGGRVCVRGQWLRIAKVMALAPGGQDILFDLEIEA